MGVCGGGGGGRERGGRGQWAFLELARAAHAGGGAGGVRSGVKRPRPTFCFRAMEADRSSTHFVLERRGLYTPGVR
jgi:hypothetical protein